MIDKTATLLIPCLALALTACPKTPAPHKTQNQTEAQPANIEAQRDVSPKPTVEDQMREEMVERQIEARGVTDPDVLAAMRAVPRHLFVPDEVKRRAHRDSPLPIGHGQTISQPFIVAKMTELLDVEPGDKVLEIGTGSGYQAAILAELGVDLFTIEIICDLADSARDALESAGYADVNVRCGDGYKGWPEEAPFDGIIVTAAPPEIPPALIEQLAPSGRMVIPVGETAQELRIVTKAKDGDLEDEKVFDVRFVPMVPGEESESP